jgi:hypothetical protein
MKIVEIYTSKNFPNNRKPPIELLVLEDGRHVITNPVSGDEYYADEDEFDEAYAEVDIEFELSDRTGEFPDSPDIINRIKELCRETAQAFVDEFEEALDSTTTDWDVFSWSEDYRTVASEFKLPLNKGEWGNYWSKYYDLESMTKEILEEEAS